MFWNLKQNSWKTICPRKQCLLEPPLQIRIAPTLGDCEGATSKTWCAQSIDSDAHCCRLRPVSSVVGIQHNGDVSAVSSSVTDRVRVSCPIAVVLGIAQLNVDGSYSAPRRIVSEWDCARSWDPRVRPQSNGPGARGTRSYRSAERGMDRVGHHHHRQEHAENQKFHFPFYKREFL